MTERIGQSGKDRLEKEPVSVTRLALETGVEFAGAALYLEETGRLSKNDGRMSASTLDASAPVAASRPAFIAEVGHYHEELADRAKGRTDQARSLKGIVGLQKRIIGAINTGADHSGLEAASLAMTFEEAGVLFATGGREGRFGRRLFELAARTSDRVTLTDRVRGFDGLISDIAARGPRSMREVASDLDRLKMLKPGDPRLSIPSDQAQALHQYNNIELLSHMKASLWPRIADLGPSADPAFSKERVLRDVANLPGRGAAPEGEIALTKRDRDFMATVARIGERVGMNLHRNGHGRSTVEAVLATSEAAAMRGAIYSKRVLAAERAQQKAAGAVHSGRDEIMM